MLDSEGHYAALGLSPSASAEEIKTAYRKLAKKHHPDAGSADDGQRFRRIAAAYDVLGDPGSRARYDSGGPKESSQSKPEKLDPIRCSRCGKITAQPRYLVFRRVFSFVFGTISSPVQGIFCSSCANSEALKSSFISAVVGWWGVPWGPIYTLRDVIRNAFGGEKPEGAEERLVWYNTLAFLSQGNYELVYGLAEKSSRAKNLEISAAARVLLGELSRSGVRGAPLRDPWRLSIAPVLLQMALALVPPLALVALLVGADFNRPRYVSSGSYASPPTKNVTQALPSPLPAPVPAKARPITACALPPRSGTVLQGAVDLIEQGHKIEIKNGSGAHAIIKVRSAATHRLLYSFFVAEGATASLEGIPDGGYIIQYAFGKLLAGNCRDFVEMESASEFPDREYFRTEYTDTEIITQVLKYTLYPVANGNVSPRALNPVLFDED